VLDDYGRVTKIDLSDHGLASKPYFSLDTNARPIAIASGANRVFVTSITSAGCTVYEFSSATKQLSSHLLRALQPCSGIATDGISTVVGFAKNSEIRFFSNSDFSKPHSIELPDSSLGYNFALDSKASVLYIGDSNGTIYQASFGDSAKPRKIIRNAGSINSLSLSKNYLLIAAGNNVLCYRRTDFSLQNLPTCMNVTVSGQLVGIRVDNQDRAWILERDRNLIMGPIALR
jgi:hypothetical protein